jgi:acetyl-CoA acetyltransferase
LWEAEGSRRHHFHQQEASVEYKNKFAICGVGYTKQGKAPGRSALSFHVEAAAAAIADAGLAPHDVDGLFLYRFFDVLEGDTYFNAFSAAEQLGLRPSALSEEFYCTRSWLTHALGLLELGVCKYIVVSYGDNARSSRRSFSKELEGDTPTDDLAAFGDISTLAKYAMLAQRAAYEDGTGPDVWGEIAVAHRRWACLNPIAGMYGKPLTKEEYLATPYLVEPFRNLDATPVSDGGRAIVLTTADRARALRKHPLVTIRGFGQANVPDAPYKLMHKDPNSAACVAGRKAFEMAGVKPADINACYIYDCFTYTVEATLRDYGFFKPNASREFLDASRIGPGGEFPLNTSGGMLSEAYFMGLTGVSEAVMQLMGRCGDRQLNNCGLALVNDNGAVIQSNETMILERGE